MISKSIRATLSYNEKKVEKGVAKCIAENGFLLKPDQMAFRQKLAVFEQRNALNERAKTNTIHVSLNFDRSENLPIGKLEQIAQSYMHRIGFGEQPFLVYQHSDAGHPHIHIVSTTIRADGSRINTHNIGRNKSENARKEIEKSFGLIEAGKKVNQPIKLSPIDVSKVHYGKTETKHAIEAVLQLVYLEYNYTSLPEFNAALRQFNIIADSGKADGKISRHKGIMLNLIDERGRKAGVPIKASALELKPTIQNLQKRFAENQRNREELKKKIKESITKVMNERPRSVQELRTILKNRQIETVLRQNEVGRIYGITFVDNVNKSVFNGSDIGKSFSIANLMRQMTTSAPFKEEIQYQPFVGQANSDSQMGTHLIDDLIMPMEEFNPVPWELKKKKRKKKK